MSSEVDELARIEAKIEQLAEAALSKGVPYLLSALGKDLGDDLQSIKLLTRRGLSDFVANRLPSKYALVIGGQHGNVKALVRTQHAEEIGSGPEVIGSDAHVAPRYNYRFWAAFSVPLAQGQRRWINRNSLIFRDIDGVSPDTDSIEIPSRLVPPSELPDRDQTIRVNLATWLTEHQLDEKEFLASRPGSAKSLAFPAVGETLLSALLGTLDHRQLTSVSMPLDVVAALVRKKL